MPAGAPPKSFKLKWAEMEERHRLMFDAHEEGKVTLAEYLNLVVFYRERPFTRSQFRRFMFAQSKPYPKMIALIGSTQDSARAKGRSRQQRSARTERL